MLISYKLLWVILLLIFCCGCKPHFNEYKVYTIYGVVSDDRTGELLSNAEVAVIEGNIYEVSNNAAVTKQVTGSDGNYEILINSKEGQSWYIIAHRDNYYQISSKIIVEERTKILNDIRMSKSTIEYSGTVTDLNKIPIQNARVYVTIMQSERQELSSTFTQYNGTYIIDVPNQNYETWNFYVTATQKGYSYHTIKMSHTPEDNGKSFILNFQLKTE